MIDNRLKKCCNDCEHDDVFTTSDHIIRKKGDLHPMQRTIIGCKHMYVCKKYIEDQEPEKS